MTAPQPFTPLDPAFSAAHAWAQPSELPPAVQELHTYDTWGAILGLASDILWAASGRRWRNVQATETVTLDPPEGCTESWVWAQASHRWGYGWQLLAPRGQPFRVRLPRPDVTAITAVTLDGDLFTAHRLSNNWVVRTDGCGWPMANTTRMTYQFGRLVAPGGRLASITLATELGKAMAGKACALPARVTSVTRQGVSFDALESLEVLKEQMTGIHSVDLWLRTVNPSRTTQAAQIWSPDLTVARKA